METYETIGTVCNLIGLGTEVGALYLMRKGIYKSLKQQEIFQDFLKPLYKNIIKPVVKKIRGNKKTIDDCLKQ